MYSLLLLDDEDEIRNGLKNYFPWQTIGFQVAADFGCAADAIGYLRDHSVDAILTDIRMPDMDGIAFIRRIREMQNHVPIVVLSGYRDFDYAQQVMALGVKHYMVKPTHHSKLTETFLNIRQELDAKNALEQSAPAAEADGPNDLIHEIKRFIRSHLETASLDGVAFHFRMNANYLSSYFHQKTREKFSDYLLRIRMKEAARLLQETDQPVSDISRQVGYMASNSFTRSFRAFFSVTPKDYRKLNVRAGQKDERL